MKLFSFLILIFIFTSMAFSQKFSYPKTEKVNVKDTYFGNEISDPYRWLEDDKAENTKSWAKEQNKITFDFLNKIPYRNKLRDALKELYNYEKISAPFKEGKFTYFYKNNGLQAQSILFQQEENAEAKIFLDPNTFSKDGTTSLAGVSFSRDGNLCAYQISEGGSDWRKVIVIDSQTKKQVEDTLIDIKFSGISWFNNEGFFYSSYDKPDGSELSAKTEAHHLFFHKIGTKQIDDIPIIFTNEDRRYISGYVTEDSRFLFISAAQSTSGNELYYLDLTKNDFTNVIPIALDLKFDYDVIDSDGETIFLQTNYKAPNNRLVKFNINKPNPENWQDIISETHNVLNSAAAGKSIFASYMIDATSKIIQYDRNGKQLREISLPGKGSAGGFGAKQEEKELYYTFTNYLYPTSIFKLDIETGKSILFRKPAIKFNADDFISKQIFYTSKDGTKIPMMISYHKKTKLNGKNPTILYAYGGFNISVTPSFSVFAAEWMKNGGIYAVPNIRGGGEYGKKWHDAGTKLKKKNVFNDFIAAGEYLIENKYTSSKFLALSGGSNGGLLVGATITMKPTLAKVALPAVGVLDMLRYHQFTAGKGWAYDYGTANDNKEMFDYLLSYSPTHNVKSGTCYPATLITTGDHDDRVVPAHSYKFAVELQEKQECENPIFIRIDTKAGHGAGKSTDQIIEEWADKMAFTFYSMKIKL